LSGTFIFAPRENFSKSSSSPSHLIESLENCSYATVVFESPYGGEVITRSMLSSSREIPSSIFLLSRMIFESDFIPEISRILSIFRLAIFLKVSLTFLFLPSFLLMSLNSFVSAFETFLTVSKKATLKKSRTLSFSIFKIASFNCASCSITSSSNQ